jgi:3-methyladenine DNA glycosylase AlkD
MEAYMRNQFPFYGVMSTPRKEILKTLKKDQLDVLDSTEKRTLIQLLWEEEHREYQLVALEWLMKWNPKEFMASDIELFEWLITTKSWWDTVDGIAPNVVGKFARVFPEQMKEKLKQWESHDSFWIRRACLIFQLRYRTETDLVLLQYFISRFKPEREFFIQKAIGWSLREVSKWNPTWVAEVVQAEQLTGLAKREASKYI